MKKNLTLGIATVLFAIISLTISSCTTDKCEGVICQNGGTCNDGSCACTTGYEGTNCQTRISEKFIGTYGGTETCDGSGASPISILITSLADPALIRINYKEALRANVSGNEITIPLQFFGTGTLEEAYSGTGTLNGNTITLGIITTDVTTSSVSSCNFTGTK